MNAKINKAGEVTSDAISDDSTAVVNPVVKDVIGATGKPKITAKQRQENRAKVVENATARQHAMEEYNASVATLKEEGKLAIVPQKRISVWGKASEGHLTAMGAMKEFMRSERCRGNLDDASLRNALNMRHDGKLYTFYLLKSGEEYVTGKGKLAKRTLYHLAVVSEYGDYAWVAKNATRGEMQSNLVAELWAKGYADAIEDLGDGLYSPNVLLANDASKQIVRRLTAMIDGWHVNRPVVMV